MLRFSLILSISIFLLTACNKPEQLRVTVSNEADIPRKGETIEVPLSNVVLPQGKSITDLRVKDANGTILLSQVSDLDGDTKEDVILFQCSFEGKGVQTFTVVVSDEIIPETTISTFGRYVPERLDDFTWENDLIAFRIYGPALQKMKEEGIPGGGISSGPDCWLKRVDYPIVNKWYEKHVAGGTYHEDDGEGLDNYHVGASAGCGGICVLEGDHRFVSKNYVSHRTITNGPIRSVFEFDYAAWDANGTMLKETKRLSIDLGNRLTKWESKFYNDALPQFGISITLHDDVNASTKVNEKEGWIRLWEKMGDSELGTAVIVPPGKFEGAHKILSDKKDESHIVLKSSAQNKELTYYAGYGWKKANAITNPAEWEAYLSNFSKRLSSPLKVEF